MHLDCLQFSVSEVRRQFEGVRSQMEDIVFSVDILGTTRLSKQVFLFFVLSLYHSYLQLYLIGYEWHATANQHWRLLWPMINLRPVLMN